MEFFYYFNFTLLFEINLSFSKENIINQKKNFFVSRMLAAKKMHL